MRSLHVEPHRHQLVANNHLDRLDTENTDLFLIVRMEVRDMVLCANFHEHSDDDAEEAAQFRHKRFLNFWSDRNQFRAVRLTACISSAGRASQMFRFRVTAARGLAAATFC